MPPMKSLRRQITLFVPGSERSRIDAIRQRYNPAQFALIAAHVTLCRDEEVLEWSVLQARARQMAFIDISLSFGPPVQDDNFVYLPAVGPTDDFHELRVRILDDEHCRRQDPHITLVHPRNGTCTATQFETIRSFIGSEFTVPFRGLTFIEQFAGAPWRRVCSFPIEDPLPTPNWDTPR